MPQRSVSARASSCLTLSSFLLLAACGASTLPPQPPAVPASPAAPPPPDVTAVAAPENLVVFGRFSKLAASSQVATDWAHIPGIDPSPFIGGILKGFEESKTLTHLEDAIDITQPIDYAATMQPKLGAEPDYAIACGVKGLDVARAALSSRYDLTPAANGVFLLETHHVMSEAKPTNDDLPKPCELAPAAGASPYRLVCASSHDALTALGPYLARTTPRESVPADAHLEVHAQPLKSFASLGRLAIPALIGNLGLSRSTDGATIDLATAFADDFLDLMSDLDTFTLDVTLDASGATLVNHTTFKSNTSLMARMATAHPERVDVPPATYLRLPADVDLASFGGGLDDADLQHPRDLAVAAAREQLKKTKLSRADQQALGDLVLELLHIPGRAVFAHGVSSGTSYWLWEADDATVRGDKLARDFVAAWTRPGVAKWLKEAAPKVNPPTLKVEPTLASLPRGSLRVVLTVPPQPAFKLPSKPTHGHGARPVQVAAPNVPTGAPEVYHLVFVPDGPRSWVVVSKSAAVDVATLASVMRGSASPSGAAGVLALKDTRASRGGFLTVRALVEMARDALKASPGLSHVPWDDVVQRLPAKGETPVLWSGSPTAPTPDDPGGAFEWRFTLPADAVRDAVWLGVNVGSM